MEELSINIRELSSIHMKCEACGSTMLLLVRRRDSYSYVSCPRCRLVTSDPKPSDMEINKYYDGFLFHMPGEKDFDVRRSSILVDVKRIVEELRKRSKGKRILDLGGGVGFYANAFGELGYDATLADLDPKACDYARGRFPRIKVVHASAIKGKFDIIFSNQVIEHYRSADGFMDCCSKHLKKGGLLVITTPNQACREHIFRPYWLATYLYMITGRNLFKLPMALLSFLRTPWTSCDPPRHIYAFNKHNMKMILSKHGYSRIEAFTEYYTDQYFIFNDFRNYKYSNIITFLNLKVIGIYTRLGISAMKLFDRDNNWGNNLVVMARKK